MRCLNVCGMLTVLLLAHLVVTIPAAGETLEAAWAESLAADHSLKAGEKTIEAARSDLQAAKSARLPTLHLSSGYTFLNEEPAAFFNGAPLTTAEDEFLTYQARLMVPVYTHFQISHTIDAATAGLDATGYEQEVRVRDLRLQVAETYISVLLAEKQLTVAESHVASLTAIADDIENMYDQGMVAKNDLLAARVSLANARQTELSARNQLDTARAAYNRLLVRPLDAPVQLDPIDFEAPEGSLAALVETAIAQRAELAALTEKMTALEKTAAATKAATGPKVFLSGGTEYTENSHQVHEDLWSAGIHLSWDVFDGNVARHKSQAALNRADAVREQRRNLESVIRLRVRDAWLKMQESQARINVAADALKQAEENLSVSRNRYQEGVGTNTDVLNAETLRIISRVNYENAVYDFGLAIMRLKRATGDI